MKTLLEKEIEYIKIRSQVYYELDQFITNKGYIKIEPDYFEDYNIFTQINNRINNQSTVKLIGPNNNVLLLRPDITTNIIKQIIPYWEEEITLKLYYNTTTFKQTPKNIIETREFGIEYLGDNTLQAEKEVLTNVLQMFNQFRDNFLIVLGNQLFIDELLNTINTTNKKAIKEAIMSKNQQELETLIQGTTEEELLLKDILKLNGTLQQIQNQLVTYNTPLTTNILTTLQDIITRLPNKYDNIQIDLSLLSQYDYYSGSIVQGYLKNISKPVLYGGRYNNLTKELGKEIPAFGISFDIASYIKEVKNV